MGRAIGHSGGDELEILVTLAETYERRQHSVDLPDAIDAIKFRLEQQHAKRAEPPH